MDITGVCAVSYCIHLRKRLVRNKTIHNGFKTKIPDIINIFSKAYAKQ